VRTGFDGTPPVDCVRDHNHSLRARLGARDQGAGDTQARGMRTRLHLKPGQKGTKQLLAQYGDHLACVRYRYDAHRKARLKTVDLIVVQRAWDPPAPRLTDDALLAVRVGFAEVELPQRVKQAGGNWNPSPKHGSYGTLMSARSSCKPGSWTRPHLIRDATAKAKRIYMEMRRRPLPVDACIEDPMPHLILDNSASRIILVTRLK
jgi:hypothetical protein